MKATIDSRLAELERRRHTRPQITTIEVCHRDAAGTVTLREVIELNNGYRKTQN